MSVEYDVWSASSSRASASPVTSHTSVPRNVTTFATGPLASRVSASRGVGSMPSRLSGQVSRSGTRSSRVRSMPGLRAMRARRTRERTASSNSATSTPFSVRFENCRES